MNARRTTRFACLLALLLSTLPLPAEPIRVRHAQGATRGFLILRSETGALLGNADVVQLAEGDRVTSRLTMHFRDGSLDDETAVYTQRSVFQLVSDHHIQRGPFFSKPVDVLVLANGDVTSRSLDKDGKETVDTNHLDLPPDCANGFVSTLLLNVSPSVAPFKIGMVAPTGKGRLIHLAIATEGTGHFTLANLRRSATIFRLHPELGGVAGVVAPVIGKQPEDLMLWILEGQAPAFVRGVGQLALGGPVVSLELVGTAFAAAASAK